jgi:type VI secretion system secreted protein Hcp
MKTKVMTTALVAFTCISMHLTAQEVSSKLVANGLEKNVRCTVSPTETGFSILFKNNAKEAMDAPVALAAGKKGYDYYQAQSAFSVSATDNSVREVISPRDAARGLPTGKRQHKPLTVQTEIDKSTPSIITSTSGTVVSSEGTVSRSSGSGSGKVSLQDMTVTRRCGGKTTTIPMKDDVYMIPTADCPDGDCYVKIEWTWNDGTLESNVDSSTTRGSKNSADFVWKIEEGVCTAMAINEKGLPSKKPKQNNSKN